MLQIQDNYKHPLKHNNNDRTKGKRGCQFKVNPYHKECRGTAEVQDWKEEDNLLQYSLSIFLRHQIRTQQILIMKGETKIHRLLFRTGPGSRLGSGSRPGRRPRSWTQTLTSIKKNSKDINMINLSHRKLSDTEIVLLSKGLTFTTTRNSE